MILQKWLKARYLTQGFRREFGLWALVALQALTPGPLPEGEGGRISIWMWRAIVTLSFRERAGGEGCNGAT